MNLNDTVLTTIRRNARWLLRLTALNAAKSTLLSPQLATRLDEAFRIPSIEQLINEFSHLELSGDALFEKVLGRLTKSEEPRFPFETGGCFPAGTRVWTDKGRIPIEEIKVGDKVLSQPEAGGEQCYKSVVKTFVHEDKTLRAISYEVEPENIIYTIDATDNHPFWVVEEEVIGWDEENDDKEIVDRTMLGWTQASDLRKHDHLIQLADGRYARILANRPIYRTEVGGQGWSESLIEESGYGVVMDYVNHKIIANGVPGNKENIKSNDPYLKVRVYNFEVEDFHTYYVAGGGVWVHNANCEGVRLWENDQPSRVGRRFCPPFSIYLVGRKALPTQAVAKVSNAFLSTIL
jgi:hypothetical protein